MTDQRDSFLSRYARALWFIVAPTCLLGIIGVVLYWMGYGPFAAFLTWYGSLLVLFLGLGYAALVDSKRRWPKDNALVRLARLITFDER